MGRYSYPAIVAAVVSLAVAISLVRWARRGGRGAAMLGSAMVLLLGIGLVPEQIPQQRIEEAREEKGKKGAESGDPPQRRSASKTAAGRIYRGSFSRM
jgi:hypothetical protein